MSFAAGTKLGPYEIIALIGSGGMGEVYRARDTRLQRDVALKILAASFTNDPDRVHRFEQEARAVAALNHPNIVSIYDVGSTDSVHYIVSELLQGETLRQKITPAGMPARKAIELVIQLANGLAAAHELNIVHRDLKPENIFINRNGQLKILDFGLAKLGRQPAAKCHPDDSTISESEAGQVLGTIGYMSPEQVKGEPADQRSDIFSFGSILYEMLNGRRAFRRGTRAETRIRRNLPLTSVAPSRPLSSGLRATVLRNNPRSASSRRGILRLRLNFCPELLNRRQLRPPIAEFGLDWR